MLIYLFLLFIVFLGVRKKHSQTKSKRYCAVVFLVMWIVVGLRHITLGLTDTEFIYIPLIMRCINMNFIKVYQYFSSPEYGDCGFYLLVKIISLVSKDIHFILFVLAAPFLLATTRLIYKYSKIKWLSFLLFFGLGYFGISFYLLRQVIAIAIVMCSLDYLYRRNLIKFVIVILIASLFHQTALVFLIAYPVSFMKMPRANVALIPICFALSIALKSSFLKYIFIALSFVMKDTSRYDNYMTDDSSLSLTEFFEFVLIVLIVYLLFFKNLLSFRKIEHSDQTEMQILFNIVLIGVYMLPFTLLLGEISRLASYFTVFSILLLPNAIQDTVSIKNNKFIILSIVGSVFSFYFLFIRLENSNLAPYSFFWSN